MRLWFVLPVRVPPPNDGKVVVEGLRLVVGGVNQPSILTYGIFLRRGSSISMAAGIAVIFFTLDS
jgi:hypothetical protein